MREALGSRLRRLRESRQWTQNDLARHLEAWVSSVSAWESGSRMPDLRTAARIARVYDVSLSELLDGIDLDAEPAGKGRGRPAAKR